MRDHWETLGRFYREGKNRVVATGRENPGDIRTEQSLAVRGVYWCRVARVGPPKISISCSSANNIRIYRPRAETFTRETLSGFTCSHSRGNDFLFQARRTFLGTLRYHVTRKLQTYISYFSCFGFVAKVCLFNEFTVLRIGKRRRAFCNMKIRIVLYQECVMSEKILFNLERGIFMYQVIS